MRELKLKYFIELASNIGAKAKADARMVVESQRGIQQSVDKTGASVGRLESLYNRFGSNNATERQARYMRGLGQTIDNTAAKMRGLQQLAAKGLQAAPGAVAGAVGGFYAAKALLDKPMDYDMRLRGATATAYAGQDAGALRIGYQEVRELIDRSIKDVSGASRDSTLGAYEKLVGSGSFSKEESAKLLAEVMRAAVATRANPDDLVQTLEKLKVGEFKLTVDELPLALAKITRAGQEGGFEIKDAAKHIGLLTPLMKGYKGMAGVEALVTMMQQVRSTSGTNDQAATNLVNFLQKIPAESTRKDFKKQGIDLDQEMVNGALKGLTPVDIYMAALEKVMAKQDPEGKARAAMRNADKAASPEEQKLQYDRVAEIYKSAGISKIINDIQEFGGYSGLAGTKEYGKKVFAAVRSETGGAVQTGYDFMTEGTGAKAIDLGNRKDKAMSDALDTKSGILNKALDGAIELADAFPKTTAAATGAATALAVLAASATGLFGLMALRNAGGVGLPGAAKGAPAAAAERSALSTLYNLAGPAAVPAMSTGAVGAAMAGGLLAVGAPILGAGVLLSNQANSRDGLRGRIADRTARLGELSDLEALGGSPAALARIGAEKAALWRDRESMAAQQNAIGGGGDGVRGRGYNDPRLLTLTSPGNASQPLTAGSNTKVEIGQGELAVKVTVTDERTSASTSVTTPMAGIRLNAGATNPGGGR